MTLEDKELLLKDLCARLPYGVKLHIPSFSDTPQLLQQISDYETVEINDYTSPVGVGEVKPYLRPMSSMTEEEKNELRNILWFGYPSDDNDRYSHRGVEVKQCLYDDEKHSTYDFGDFIVLQNFLLKNHFDYCGLIPTGLALEATKDMYNI